MHNVCVCRWLGPRLRNGQVYAHFDYIFDYADEQPWFLCLHAWSSELQLYIAYPYAANSEASGNESRNRSDEHMKQDFAEPRGKHALTVGLAWAVREPGIGFKMKEHVLNGCTVLYIDL